MPPLLSVCSCRMGVAVEHGLRPNNNIHNNNQSKLQNILLLSLVGAQQSNSSIFKSICSRFCGFRSRFTPQMVQIMPRTDDGRGNTDRCATASGFYLLHTERSSVFFCLADDIHLHIPHSLTGQIWCNRSLLAWCTGTDITTKEKKLPVCEY